MENKCTENQSCILGGIPFVLTNVPQSMLSFSCVNPIYGTTTNPYASTRTCGGSSGGEAALISLGGSIIGIGTDVGGSIRYPCHFCGIAGFKVCFTEFYSPSYPVYLFDHHNTTKLKKFYGISTITNIYDYFSHRIYDFPVKVCFPRFLAIHWLTLQVVLWQCMPLNWSLSCVLFGQRNGFPVTIRTLYQ